jgi:alginate biosynthesis protein AlgX
MMQALAALVLLASAALPPRLARADTPVPTFAATPCCSLCPRAAQATSYVTRFMASNRVLVRGSDDWLFRTEADLDTSYLLDPRTQASLARMLRAFNARGTQVLLVDLPRRGLLAADRLLPADRARQVQGQALRNYQLALQQLRDLGFIVPDYSLLATQGNGGDFYFHRDAHWTPEGARRTAGLVADTISALPLHDGLRQAGFQTATLGLQRHPGALAIVAAQICGGNWPAEVTREYSTMPADADLLGEVPAPEIVLVGTSFSANPLYHFAGFLQQSLQADVQNAAVAGSNFEGAMTQYLLSETFRTRPPKLLIWEFTHQQLAVTNPAQLRRLLPLIDEGCRGRPALLARTVKLSPGDGLTELLFNGGGSFIPAHSRELTVDMQFANPDVTEVIGEAWYEDGSHEQLRMRMNDYAPSGGRFVMELSREPEHADQPLIDFRVQVITPLTAATTVSATLCRAPDASSAR